MPVMGSGVWRMEGKSIRDLISAIKIGYRHFDCADFGNKFYVTRPIHNYDIFLTRDCLAYSKVKRPAVNQFETHPYFQRDSLVNAHTIGGGAANTVRFGSVSCLDDPAFKALAKKYKKTIAQLVLRWGIQRHTVVIPKSSKLQRLEENFEVLDFELAKEDMELIKNADRKYRTNQPAKFWGVDLYA
ncbi:hypothetical protein MKW94_019978 [Papaver nudicaule]|uniref:NADP-dependent oxidoreductase domain-containing protein n=1 Tax=Papaver nudicaule TaxID=74823 RepID=A0AA41VV49_PAPNU|nr:hypothetical protein [Papaver nudicaule]